MEENRISSLFSTQIQFFNLKDFVNTSTSQLICPFNKSIEAFYRAGRIPACVGGMNALKGGIK